MSETRVTQQLSAALKDLEFIPAAGPSSRLGKLVQPLARLRQQLTAPAGPPVVDVHISERLDPSQLDTLAEWLGSDFDDPQSASWIRRHSLEPTRASIVGESRGALVVLALADDSSGVLSAWHDEERPIVVVRPDERKVERRTSPPPIKPSATAVELTYSSLEPRGLDALLDRADLIPSREALNAQGQLSTSLSALKALRSACARETRGVAALKRSCEDTLRQTHSQVTGGDAVQAAELRSTLQAEMGAIRRDQTEALATVIDPARGHLSLEVEEQIARLDHLEQTRGPRADATSIPPEHAHRLDDLVTTTLRAHFQHALESLEMRVGDLARDLGQRLESLGVSQVPLHAGTIMPQRLDQLLQQAATRIVPYSGELPRRGLMDYFMAARRYQMMFFMVFSTIGLSFVRSYREFTIPSAVFLLSIGLLHVAHSTRRERSESLARELGRAREAMRNGLKSVFSDVQRDWDVLLNEHLAAVQERFLMSLEAAVSADQEQRKTRRLEEQRNLQSRVKALDRRERSLQQADRLVATSLQRLEATRQQMEAATALGRARSEAGGRLLQMRKAGTQR